MKLFLVASLAVLAAAAPRQKRLSVGTIAIAASGAGGATGCVVTGNNLYINGFKQRELTAAEQTEMSDYQKNIDEYKTAVKAAVAEKQKALEERMSGKKSVTPVKSIELPKAPAKPSFCSAEDTTQYIFDGCMVQNNKVYVGREFARDLTSAEVEELKEFDVKQSAYQKYVQEQVSKQVKGLFGSSDIFSALFNDGPAENAVATTRASTAVETTAPEAPKVPNFCTAVY